MKYKSSNVLGNLIGQIRRTSLYYKYIGDTNNGIWSYNLDKFLQTKTTIDISQKDISNISSLLNFKSKAKYIRILKMLLIQDLEIVVF